MLYADNIIYSIIYGVTVNKLIIFYYRFAITINYSHHCIHSLSRVSYIIYIYFFFFYRLVWRHSKRFLFNFARLDVRIPHNCKVWDNREGYNIQNRTKKVINLFDWKNLVIARTNPKTLKSFINFVSTETNIKPISSPRLPVRVIKESNRGLEWFMVRIATRSYIH